MHVFEKETRPTLDAYPQEIIHRIDATMSQIRVLHEILEVLVPISNPTVHDQVLDQGLALCRASGNRSSVQQLVAGLGYAAALQGRLAEGRALQSRHRRNAT